MAGFIGRHHLLQCLVVADTRVVRAAITGCRMLRGGRNGAAKTRGRHRRVASGTVRGTRAATRPFIERWSTGAYRREKLAKPSGIGPAVVHPLASYSFRTERKARMRTPLGLVAALVTAAVGLAPAVAAHAADSTPSPAANGSTVRVDQKAYDQALKSSDWVKTPGGLAHKDCVHQVPNDSTIDNGQVTLPSGARQSLKACTHPRIVKPGATNAAPTTGAARTPATNGWQSSTWWNSPTWMRKMTTNYTVPEAPSTNGALNFFFSSMETGSFDAIVQPVLTYGGNGGLGGNYWYANSWFVGPGGSVTGPTVRAQPGDTVVGSMEGVNCDSNGANCTWAITSTNARTGERSTINVASASSYTWAQSGVFESYGASSCSMLPANRHIGFWNVYVYGPNLEQLTPDYYASYG